MRLAQGHVVRVTETRRRSRSPLTKCLRSVLTCLGLCILPWVPAFCQNTFFPFPIDQDALGGAPDFSSLNRPLGLSDQLVVRDGHFCRGGVPTAPRNNAKVRAPAALVP